MSIREIVSDGCFLGWPACVAPRANRHVAYHYLEAYEVVVCEEKESGETIIRAADYSSVTTYSPGLEPVIIRRPRR